MVVPNEPQGFNSQILLLDLYLVQRPGMWPQVFVWKPARYDKTGTGLNYTQVQIVCGEEVVADMPVEEVH